jgi:hypothetical protein
METDGNKKLNLATDCNRLLQTTKDGLRWPKIESGQQFLALGMQKMATETDGNS